MAWAKVQMISVLASLTLVLPGQTPSQVDRWTGQKLGSLFLFRPRRVVGDVTFQYFTMTSAFLRGWLQSPSACAVLRQRQSWYVYLGLVAHDYATSIHQERSLYIYG